MIQSQRTPAVVLVFALSAVAVVAVSSSARACEDTPAVPAAEMASVVDGNNAFALDLYARLKGQEAAAATAVVMDRATAILPSTPIFRADHPFLFLIRDRQTGSILFRGRVVDPSNAG